MPSQRFLIAKMIAPVPETYRGQGIEPGVGNGALTLRLAARCPEARILACEINPTLARDIRGNLAAAGLSGRVGQVGQTLHNARTVQPAPPPPGQAGDLGFAHVPKVNEDVPLGDRRTCVLEV